MNKLGKLLKMLRLENGEVLYDMAKRLGVSSAFLSAVENDRKSPPLSWVDTIASEYQLSEERKGVLMEAISQTIKQVRMDIGDASPSKKNCALAFARSFDDFSEEDVTNLMDYLRKRRQ